LTSQNDLLNFPKFCEKHLRITTKSGTEIPFILKPYQLRIANVIQEMIDAGLPVRIIILKARQLGISTLVAAYLYYKTITNKYIRSLTIAHDEESTINIFEMSHRFYDLSDIQPMKRFSNRKELVFENPDNKSRQSTPGLMSKMGVATAGKKTAGRSKTIHNLHISELPYWLHAKKTMAGLVSSVPNKANSCIIIEATANGMSGDGGVFYEKCVRAQTGLDEFRFIFIAWFEDDDYRMKPPMGFKAEGKIADLAVRFPELDDEQLYWATYTLKNVCDGDWMTFCQEYPSTPEEAFVLSGRPFFNQFDIIKRISLAKDVKYKQGYLDDKGVFHESSDGMLRIYEEPQEKGIYGIGADVAEGLEDGDADSAFVIDRKMRQVARFFGRIDPDQFGKELIKLGKYYNNALLAPELNNHGHAVLARLKNDGYINIYTREVYDELADRRVKKLAWLTTSKSKMHMLDEFKAAYRDGDITIKDVELFKEMKLLQIEEDGNVILNGKDLTVSACIAVQCIKQLPKESEYRADIPEETRTLPFAERMKKLEKKNTGWGYR